MARHRRGNTGENPISLFSFQDILLAVMGLMIFITLIMSLELTKTIMESDEVTAQKATQTQADAKDIQKQILQLQAIESQLSSDIAKRVETAREKLKDAQAPKDITTTQPIDQPQNVQAAMTQFKFDLEKLKTLAQEVKEKTQYLSSDKEQIKALLIKSEELDKSLTAAKLKLDEARGNPRISYILQGENARQPILFEISGKTLLIGTPGDSDRTISIPADQINEKTITQIVLSFNRKLVFIVLLVKPSGFQHFRTIMKAVQAAGFESGRDAIEEDHHILIPPQ
jgi:hypothetical protein